MDEKFNLTWHTFQNHTDELLHNLYKSSQFSDVTLVCDDKSVFNAHRFILSAASPVLRNIMNLNDQSAPIIYLRGI